MKKGDKKGLSTIVATLLVILLVIVSVMILWGVIRSVIKNNAETISLGQFTVSLEIVKVYPSDGTNPTGIKVKRNGGAGDLEGITFSIFDGEETHIFTEHIPQNESLDEFEIRTFFVDYTGNITSVSIYPIFLTESEKTLTGDLQDTYYVYYTGSAGGPGSPGNGTGPIDPDCEPYCLGKECGDDGCGNTCPPGCSGLTPYCVSGNCEADDGGIIPDCSCAVTTCAGRTCDDGLGGSCYGALQPNCGEQMCGEAPNGCGEDDECGTCSTGWWCDSGLCCQEGEHNSGGVCQTDCDPITNCAGKECGDDGCGGTCAPGDCEYEYGTGYICNESGLCKYCDATANCAGKECGDDGCGGECGDCHDSPFNSSYECNFLVNLCEMCTPDCSGGRDCGESINGCGTCGTNDGACPDTNYTCIDGICTAPETALNIGTVLSVWPTPIGRNLFTGSNLPEYGEPYSLDNAHYVKITGGYTSCYQIISLDYPRAPGQYTVIEVSKFPTNIEEGDAYEIWETINGCS